MYYQDQNGTKMASFLIACLKGIIDYPVGVNETFRKLEDRDVTRFTLHAFHASVNACGDPEICKN